MSPTSLTREDSQRLVAQWQVTGDALQRLRMRTLASQSAEESRQSALDMLDFASALAEDPKRVMTSGLIEMQRLFADLRVRGRR